MDMEVDHYAILGLPSGEEGSKLSEKEISKAYKAKALELHPDKRRDDPNAHDNFQRLKSSYEILKDEKARKLFDDLLKVKREQQRRHSERDSKRRRMVSDLEERERASFAPDGSAGRRAAEEEERIAKKFREEVARIRAMHASRGAATTAAAPGTGPGKGRDEETGNGKGVDKEKILKVSWEKEGEDYSDERLRELFSRFGKVEDVVVKHTKKKRSALVVMASKEAAAAATRTMCGDLLNPLLVLPFLPARPAEVPHARDSAESERVNNLSGVGYQAFEDAVLKKLQMAAEKQKKGV